MWLAKQGLKAGVTVRSHKNQCFNTDAGFNRFKAGDYDLLGLQGIIAGEIVASALYG
jgi:hypothetical protein